MPYSDTAKNSMLAAIGVTHASLHSAWPGTTGANEITGGSPAYARKAVTFGAAASGVRTQSGSAVFDVPGGSTLQFVGFWDALTAGNFLGAQPVGGQASKEFVVDITTETFTSPGHGYANGQMVVFMRGNMASGTVPGGLAEGTIYYVVGATTDTFQVSATSGGSAVNVTSTGTSDVQVCRIIPEAPGSQGTLTLSGSQLGLGL